MRAMITAHEARKGYNVVIEFENPNDRLAFFRMLRKAEKMGAAGIDAEVFFGEVALNEVRHAQRKGWLPEGK